MALMQCLRCMWSVDACKLNSRDTKITARALAAGAGGVRWFLYSVYNLREENVRTVPANSMGLVSKSEWLPTLTRNYHLGL